MSIFFVDVVRDKCELRDSVVHSSPWLLSTIHTNLIVECGSSQRATLKEVHFDWPSYQCGGGTATLVSISTSHSPPIGKIFKFFELVSPAIKTTSPHSSATPPRLVYFSSSLVEVFLISLILEFFFSHFDNMGDAANGVAERFAIGISFGNSCSSIARISPVCPIFFFLE